MKSCCSSHRCDVADSRFRVELVGCVQIFEQGYREQCGVGWKHVAEGMQVL